MGEDTLHLEIENVGGIHHAERALSPGITVIQGPNASNKSSFLKGLLFALGARTVPIRSGAESARVALTLGDQIVERTAHRTENGIRTEGDGWIEDADDALLVERFAGLLETNSLRSTVARNEPVETLLKEPMDLEALEARREELLRRKRSLSEDLSATDDVDERLEERERALSAKRDRLEALDGELDSLRAEQDDAVTDDDVEALRDERAELRSRESEYESAVSRLESAIDRLESRRDELAEELEVARDEYEEADVAALERERESIRADIEETRTRLDVLQSVLTANREMLDSEFAGTLGQDAGLLEDELRCWACGRTAPTADFEGTVEELTELVTADKRRIREAEPEIEGLTERIEAVQRREGEIERLEADRQDVQSTLADRRDSLAERRDQLSSVRERLDEFDAEIDRHEADQQSTTAALTEEIEDARVERRTVEREIERLEDEIDDLEATRERRQRRRAEIEELTEEIAALTDRIENLETELREVFNDAMDDLLEVLAFEEVERVWLDGEFDLVIARSVDGTVRTDTVDHLAESEREMIGLVLGLAGFVTYEVDAVTPVLVLDSLGAFDADRTRALVEYFGDETDYLVASAHPELGIAGGFDTIGVEPAGAD